MKGPVLAQAQPPGRGCFGRGVELWAGLGGAGGWVHSSGGKWAPRPKSEGRAAAQGMQGMQGMGGIMGGLQVQDLRPHSLPARVCSPRQR